MDVGDDSAEQIAVRRRFGNHVRLRHLESHLRDGAGQSQLPTIVGSGQLEISHVFPAVILSVAAVPAERRISRASTTDSLRARSLDPLEKTRALRDDA